MINDDQLLLALDPAQEELDAESCAALGYGAALLARHGGSSDVEVRPFHAFFNKFLIFIINIE